MLYAIGYVLYAVCYIPYAMCYMLYDISYMLYAIYSPRGGEVKKTENISLGRKPLSEQKFKEKL